MPIYEYQCEGCGHRLEAMQSIKDTPLLHCPECHEDRLRKQISAAGFRLKGSGWYVTDFRDGGKKKEASPAGKEAAKSGEGESASTTAATGETSAPASASSTGTGTGTAAASGPSAGSGGGGSSGAKE